MTCVAAPILQPAPRAMTGFDLAIIGVIALSALFAFVRGIMRELIALVAWVAGFVAGDRVCAAVGAR